MKSPFRPAAGGGRAARHRRIGLLGGSFNPAHQGHLQLSLNALARLGLDEVWWLVSPQNPLKPAAGMARFADRLAAARRATRGHPRIRVSDLENRLGGGHYTIDTVLALRRRFPRLRFVWLMGADNLVQLRYWQRWPEIFAAVPIAVFDRPCYSLKALAGLAAARFARYRLPEAGGRRLAETAPPAWVFLHTPLDPSSATRIRSARRSQTVMAEVDQPGGRAMVTPLVPRARAPRGPRLSPRELLSLVVATLEDGKAEDLVTIDLAGKTTIADYMVVATGRSARQVAALTEHLEAALRRRAHATIEGKAQGDWVLIDAGDVIIHLFRPEIRTYYNLEKLWSEALPDTGALRQ
ncbi:MAG TPA: nicotinate-nucleotide adenylyltransferase [Stellaceae bacterium]|nr:nicotinate-nucleotide adenylyltransferase [Stellaceae bacterium]